MDPVKKVIISPQRNCAVSGKGRKRHSYKISKKLEAIAYAEDNSKEGATRKFRVDARRFRKWCQKKADLETIAQASQRKRPHGGGRDRDYFKESARVQDFPRVGEVSEIERLSAANE